MPRTTDVGGMDAPEGSEQPLRAEQKDYQRINQVIQVKITKKCIRETIH